MQGYSPLQAGLRILPWTAMPIFVAPIAGALSDRIGGRTRSMAVGLSASGSGSCLDRDGLESRPSPTARWSSRSSSPGSAWRSTSRRSRTSSSSGTARRRRARPPVANNAIRELGGVFGVAVLAAVFAHYGGYSTARQFRRTALNASGLRGRRRSSRSGRSAAFSSAAQAGRAGRAGRGPAGDRAPRPTAG